MANFRGRKGVGEVPLSSERSEGAGVWGGIGEFRCGHISQASEVGEEGFREGGYWLVPLPHYVGATAPPLPSIPKFRNTCPWLFDKSLVDMCQQYEA